MRTNRLTINLNPDESQIVHTAAEAAGVGKSAWARQSLLSTAEGQRHSLDLAIAQAEILEAVAASEERAKARLQRAVEWLANQLINQPGGRK